MRSSRSTREQQDATETVNILFSWRKAGIETTLLVYGGQAAVAVLDRTHRNCGTDARVVCLVRGVQMAAKLAAGKGANMRISRS